MWRIIKCARYSWTGKHLFIHYLIRRPVSVAFGVNFQSKQVSLNLLQFHRINNNNSREKYSPCCDITRGWFCADHWSPTEKMKKLKMLKIYSLICIFALVTVYELISLLFLHETSSLVLLADTYHNFFTLLSLILLVISHKVSKHGHKYTSPSLFILICIFPLPRSKWQIKYARTLKNTFGWARLGILGKMVNLIFFSSLLFSLAVGCIQTIAHAGHEQVQPENPSSLIIFGSLGVVMYLVLQMTAGGM